VSDDRATSDNTTWQAAVLSVVAGYADAVGFMTFGAFAGAMTGNTVLLGIAVAGANFEDALRSAIVIASFLAGVTAGAVLRRRIPLASIFAIEAAAIVTAAVIAPVFAAPTLAFAMGLQNAAMTRFGGASLNTVVLTGNLQKMMQAFLERFERSPAVPASATVGAGAIAEIWLAYLGGVMIGALAWHWVAYPLLPAVLLLPAALLRQAPWRGT
jgi:uncharacterized membrane protein YoaK (UPF0700 family)